LDLFAQLLTSLSSVLMTSIHIHIQYIFRYTAIGTAHIHICISSAYICTSQLDQTFGRSFTYIENSNVPRNDPWGTPRLVNRKPEVSDSFTKHWDRPIRYVLIKLI